MHGRKELGDPGGWSWNIAYRYSCTCDICGLYLRHRQSSRCWDELVESKAGVKRVGLRANLLDVAMLKVCGGSVATLKTH